MQNARKTCLKNPSCNKTSESGTPLQMTEYMDNPWDNDILDLKLQRRDDSGLVCLSDESSMPHSTNTGADFVEETLQELAGGSDFFFKDVVPHALPAPSLPPPSASIDHFGSQSEISVAHNMAATTLDSNTEPETQSEKTRLRITDTKNKTKVKKSVAEFSRASREKRKREVEYLKARNKQLVAEREEFLEKVAKLQSDAQYLRCNNEINLERENKILRAEVEEHKRFFRSLQQFLADQSVIQKDSDSLSDELSNEIKEEVEMTKQQLLLQAATSSVEQVLGLCLTTSVNPSMQVAKLDDEKLSEKVKLYYQNLPVGSTAKTCKRVIIRLETKYDVPFEKGIVAIKKLIGNQEMTEKKYETFCKDTVLVAIEELGTLDSHPDLPKGTICKAVSHKIQDKDVCKTMVFITTEQVRNVPVRGMFREQLQKDTQVQNDSPPNAETFIVATIQDETVDLAPLFDGAVPNDVVAASGAHVNGILCSKNADGTMHVVSLLNSPSKDLNMFGETIADSIIWIDDDGKPGPKLAAAVKQTFDFELMIKMTAMDLKEATV